MLVFSAPAYCFSTVDLDSEAGLGYAAEKSSFVQDAPITTAANASM